MCFSESLVTKRRQTNSLNFFDTWTAVLLSGHYFKLWPYLSWWCLIYHDVVVCVHACVCVWKIAQAWCMLHAAFIFFRIYRYLFASLIALRSWRIISLPVIFSLSVSPVRNWFCSPVHFAARFYHPPSAFNPNHVYFSLSTSPFFTKRTFHLLHFYF